MKKIIFSFIILISLISFNFVFAVDAVTNAPVNTSPDGVTNKAETMKTTTIKTPTLQNPLNASSIEEVIILAVDLAIYVGTAFAVLVLIFIGFKFVLAQGNSEKLTEAKRWFLWVIVGLAILISSKVVVEIVKNTLIKAGVAKQEFFNKR